MNNIIEKLGNYAMDNGIGVEMCGLLDPLTPAACNTVTKKVVINTNWYRPKQIPFTFAHEIAHILNGDVENRILYFSSAASASKIELAANTTAIKLLTPYYVGERPEEYIRSSEFMDIFDIPGHLENTIERELTAVLLKAPTTKAEV